MIIVSLVCSAFNIKLSELAIVDDDDFMGFD